MPLAPGARLGRYEVRDLIGAGGMGEVYRGHDGKLNRSVALKILPEVFALDADRLSRFKREAQVLASLNHANIGSIFGFEESNGVHVLVLELVDGPTLAECIARGRFPKSDPKISPDMRWLAYASTETGRNEVYVQPFPPTGQRWQVSSSGGRQPQWRADGRELYFVGDDRRFHAVDIADNAGSFEFGVPKFLFEMRANTFNSRNSYVPSRDGQRFLVNMLLGADDAPISVVQNWQTGLGK